MKHKHHNITPEQIKDAIFINGLDETLLRVCDLMDDIAEQAINSYKFDQNMESISKNIAYCNEKYAMKHAKEVKE